MTMSRMVNVSGWSVDSCFKSKTFGGLFHSLLIEDLHQ